MLDEVDIKLDELDKLDLTLEDDVTAELDEAPQALTKPKGEGCDVHVELAMQLFPFS